MVLLRILRRGQHESDGSALEERQAGRRLEQERDTQGIAIELDGPVQVVDHVGDLADFSSLEVGHGALRGQAGVVKLAMRVSAADNGASRSSSSRYAFA